MKKNLLSYLHFLLITLVIPYNSIAQTIMVNERPEIGKVFINMESKKSGDSLDLKFTILNKTGLAMYTHASEPRYYWKRKHKELEIHSSSGGVVTKMQESYYREIRHGQMLDVLVRVPNHFRIGVPIHFNVRFIWGRGNWGKSDEVDGQIRTAESIFYVGPSCMP